MALAAIKGLNEKVEAMRGGTLPPPSSSAPSDTPPPLALAGITALLLALAAIGGGIVAPRISRRGLAAA